MVAPDTAPAEAVTRFHTREYVDLLRAVSAGDWVPHAARYGLGPGDNPIFPGLWEAAQLAAGGSIRAAEAVAEGEAARAFHFAGGLHHAMPDRASGFCYVNDAVLAIMTLRRRGLRVATWTSTPITATACSSPSTTIPTCSRSPRTSAGTGLSRHRLRGRDRPGPGVGYSVNLPLQPFTDDAVYEPAFEAVVPPLLRAFAPGALVLQLGIDSHRTDPLRISRSPCRAFSARCAASSSSRPASWRWAGAATISSMSPAPGRGPGR